MTTQELFDLVAPIAIYHGTDVCYKEKAVKAIQTLFDSVDTTVRMNFGFKGKYEDWQEYLETAHPDNLPNILDIYGTLFHEIVEETLEDPKRSYDRWGAIQYHDCNGEFIFAGDACGAYPWFETAALLVERLNDHVNEHANDHETDPH